MKRINLFLSDQEYQNLEFLLKKYGGKATGFLRILLKEAFQEEFGGYKGKQIQKEIKKEFEAKKTPEQLCEESGGTVTTENGIRVCKWRSKLGNMSTHVAITNTEMFETCRKSMGI